MSPHLSTKHLSVHQSVHATIQLLIDRFTPVYESWNIDPNFPHWTDLVTCVFTSFFSSSSADHASPLIKTWPVTRDGLWLTLLFVSSRVPQKIRRIAWVTLLPLVMSPSCPLSFRGGSKGGRRRRREEEGKYVPSCISLPCVSPLIWSSFFPSQIHRRRDARRYVCTYVRVGM